MPRRVIGFAHRGARADARENTLEAFSLALTLGADGVETDAWLTADGVVVLDHDGVVEREGRRLAIAAVPRAGLPVHVPSLPELFDVCGPDVELSVDIKPRGPEGREVAAAVVEVARRYADPARLWLCGDGLEVAAWRSLDPRVRLAAGLSEGALRRTGLSVWCPTLADAGASAVNLPGWSWTRGRVDAVHAAGLLAFGWRAHSVRHLRRLRRWGCDAVYCDHVARMRAVLDEGP